MAINKAVRAALSILSYPEIDIKKTYMVEREINKLLAHRSKNSSLYRIWKHPVLCDGHNVPVHIFTPAAPAKAALLVFFHGGGWVS
jgi:acetyl esterase